jgi:hypothetical protein
VENELRRGYVPFIATRLVADLLVESGDAIDAQRLLSERARELGSSLLDHLEDRERAEVLLRMDGAR